jgi:peptide/nickel transport system substrate-binding protein
LCRDAAANAGLDPHGGEDAMTKKTRRSLRAGLTAAATGTAMMALAGGALAQALPDVPRNRTLISQGWDFYNQVPATTNFNPYAGVLLHQRNNLHYTINEQLFYTNHLANQVMPWLATGWTQSADFREVTLTLRDGVTWSDGKPFGADDVVFTFEMLKAAAPDLVLSGAIREWVASAEAVDRLTVRIRLTKPGPRWPQDFLATGQASRFVVVPKHIWQGQDPKTFGFYDPARGWPVGTGPFKLVKSDANSLVFDLRDSWWAVERGVARAMPQVRRVIYVPATEQAMPQLFASGQIDIGRSIQPGTFDAIRQQNRGLRAWFENGPVWGVSSGCVFAIRFNLQVAPYSDPAVRRAINFAINRAQIVDLALEGSVRPASLPFSSYGGLTAYTSKLKDVLDAERIDRFDIAETARILEQRGYRKGANGFWNNPDGTPWKLAVSTAQGDPQGPVIVQQLRNAGFDALNNAQQRTALADATSAGNFEMSHGTHCGSLYDPWQTLEHFHSKYAAPAGQKIANIRAVTRYANPAFDALVDRMEATRPSPDDAAYLDLVREALKIYLRDLPQVTLAEEFHTLPFNNTHWTGFPNEKDPYVAPFIPWEGFAQVIHRLRPTR